MTCCVEAVIFCLTCATLASVMESEGLRVAFGSRAVEMCLSSCLCLVLFPLSAVRASQQLSAEQ